MRIAIIGAGAVGGYFGGRLAQVGEEVIFLARGENLQALQNNGLRVDSIDGDFIIYPVQAVDDIARIGRVEAVLVCVKAWQVPEIAASLRMVSGLDTCVLPLVNGVDAPEQLAAALGSEHVLGGLCRISAYRAGPGFIRHVGIHPSIALGELDNHASARVEQLRAILERSGIQARVPPDIRVAMWEKFLFIAAISGIGAVTRAPIGVVRAIPETRELLENALQEILAVARARKIALPEDSLQRVLGTIDQLPGDTVASMQRDILNGRPSELGAQSGAVVRMGLESGVPTPTHAFIFASLLPQELQARGEIAFSAQ